MVPGPSLFIVDGQADPTPIPGQMEGHPTLPCGFCIDPGSIPTLDPDASPGEGPAQDRVVALTHEELHRERPGDQPDPDLEHAGRYLCLRQDQPGTHFAVPRQPAGRAEPGQAGYRLHDLETLTGQGPLPPLSAGARAFRTKAPRGWAGGRSNNRK